MSTIDRLLDPIPIPRLVKVRQGFKRPQVSDVAAELVHKLRAAGAFARVKAGDRVAITAGSRGITGLPLVLKTVAAEIRKAGGEPFL
ncbi:MAG TPA: hypothetical protein VLH81_08435, partial [Desulfobacterales bacterium]|nr:hypothetical protein [Desulfobacterales bacterium]